MTRHLYAALLFLLTPLLALYLKLRARKDPEYNRRWRERFGLRDWQACDVLIHCVSIGETLAALPLIAKIEEDYPKLKLLITCSSPTGSRLIRQRLSQHQHSYLPLDINWAVTRFVKRAKPRLCVIMETELWPNLVYQLKQHKCAVCLANVRLSQKSFEQYAKWPRLTRPMLTALDKLMIQTPTEAQRFAQLGVDSEQLHSVGSLKFDLVLSSEQIAAASALAEQWQRPSWVAGSVHPNEFDALIRAHQQVLKQHADALMVMVPRHPEKFDTAKAALSEADLRWQAWSEGQSIEPETQVLVGDTMGQLLTFYGATQMAFVGGSLMERGGHNPLEPAAFSKPVMMGPSRYNFAEISDALEGAGNLVLVDSAQALANRIVSFIDNPAQAAKAGKAGAEIVAANQGALNRHFALLTPYLDAISSDVLP
ncbi:lipid IV(A) 3-deoxy-D-manno-octulosonic acid transferase [Paraferrimonas sedimenticola]|uniref:3-deoxy-D-manno-octulosonic acid transferase n=1 Tax=Paraferrimonas sedimenticola TaxID=375674 RepID=A0AA37RZ51_9GAMM|nr:lipid IV(A) 3-deoxy-D-manno-octulosonic acid transferase [Paraferrimonas sedimenticola]GLP97532.1 3-deoxy-D-manno-octulosonic acid transferase [Paraferrimonas sedimenticola]